MSMGVRSWRFSSSSTPNINEAPRKDAAASLHKNVLPWSVWRRHEDGKESASPSLRRVTRSGRADCLPHSKASNLFRTASVPDVVADGGNPETAFSSISISAHKVARSGSSLHPETFCPSRVTGAMRALTPPEPFRSRAFSGMQSIKCATRAPVSQPSMKGSGCALRSSASQPDLCMHVPSTITRAKEFIQGSSTCDRVTIRGPGNRKVQTLEHRHSFTEGDRNQDLLGDSMTLSSSRSYCSRIDLQVPLRSSSTVVFLDKSLSLSLVELEGRRATGPALHTSTLSVRLRGSSCRELCTDKPAQTDGGYRRTKAATGDGNTRADPENSLSKQRGHKGEKTALAHVVNRKADDSDMRSHGMAWRSAVLQPPSYAEATRRKSNADEAERSTQSNFRHRTSSMSLVNSQTWGRQTLGETKQQGHGTRDARTSHREMTCYRSHQLDSLNVTRRTLSLKEALELFRPDFISRSQGRVRRLEQKTRRRRALQDSNLDLTQGLREDGCSRRRNCTTPHPLSDNLFRPRERSISGREMQLRSKRIYNKLPEVTNKKKEERKRAVSQTNRLRAEVFKKKLLGQILQR